MKHNTFRQQSPTTKKGRYLSWQTRFLCASMKWPRSWGYPCLYAYKLIRQMNEELAKTGCITISGRIDRKFFHEKFMAREPRRRERGVIMAAFKNKDNGTWYVQFRYTDWKGERQQKLKGVLPPSEKRWNGNGSS